MEREDYKKYLRMLGYELQQQQVTGEILICDNMLMLLEIRQPKIRRDIGAYLAGDDSAIHIPKDIASYFSYDCTTIRETILHIACSQGVASDWLTDALKTLFFPDASSEKWLEYPGLRIYLASPEYMLAMKTASGSPEQSENIKVLLRKLHIAQPQDAFALVSKYIPTELMTPTMQSLIEQAFMA
jgi:hypothetical protein